MTSKTAELFGRRCQATQVGLVMSFKRLRDK